MEKPISGCPLFPAGMNRLDFMDYLATEGAVVFDYDESDLQRDGDAQGQKDRQCQKASGMAEDA